LNVWSELELRIIPLHRKFEWKIETIDK